MSSKDTEEMKAERRRGRKRGKHNFEPGYVRPPPPPPPPSLGLCSPVVACVDVKHDAYKHCFVIPLRLSCAISNSKDVRHY